jgi:hypothetical protein
MPFLVVRPGRHTARGVLLCGPLTLFGIDLDVVIHPRNLAELNTRSILYHCMSLKGVFNLFCDSVFFTVFGPCTKQKGIHQLKEIRFFFQSRNSPWWAGASAVSRLHDHTQTHHTRKDTFGIVISPTQRPLPDNIQTHRRQTSVPPVRFEPTIPANERPQTYALDRAATGISQRK